MTHIQYPQMVNVWPAIIGEHIIGTIFISGNLTAVKHLSMIRDEDVPALANSYPNAIEPSLQMQMFRTSKTAKHLIKLK